MMLTLCHPTTGKPLSEEETVFVNTNATAAMQAYVTHGTGLPDVDIAKISWKMAFAMLAERSNNKRYCG